MAVLQAFSHLCAAAAVFSIFIIFLIMQSSDVDMMERERPALDEPANQKKPKVQKDEDFGGNSISGWCTMKFMEQWMGRDFAEMVAEDRSIPKRWAGQGWDDGHIRRRIGASPTAVIACVVERMVLRRGLMLWWFTGVGARGTVM